MKRGASDDSEDDESRKPKRRKRAPAKEQRVDLSEFGGDVKTLKDIVRLAKFLAEHKQSRRKLKTGVMRLAECVTELEEFDQMIGLEELKDDVARQIMFVTLGLNDKEMMHTVLTGPPGMGKTTSIEKMAAIYAKLGFLSIGHVVSATRADMIDQYLGGTAIKTAMVLEASRGGVLLLDEAYSLGDSTGRDSFSKECINTINQFLSENPKDFMCIIAGYEAELRRNFFGSNPGLERRFQWWFRLKPYKLNDLVDIFLHQIKTQEWTLAEDISTEWVGTLLSDGGENAFKNNGGDTLILFDKCKVCHSHRVFLLDPSERKVLTRADLKRGLELFKTYKNKHSKGALTETMRHMYS